MFHIQHYHKDNKDHFQVAFIIDKENEEAVQFAIPDDSSIEEYCANMQLALNELMGKLN